MGEGTLTKYIFTNHQHTALYVKQYCPKNNTDLLNKLFHFLTNPEAT